MKLKDKEDILIEKRFCPNCKEETKQVIKLYDPDDLEGGEVWQCTECFEHTSWVE